MILAVLVVLANGRRCFFPRLATSDLLESAFHTAVLSCCCVAGEAGAPVRM